jgi:hypothetical protein
MPEVGFELMITTSERSKTGRYIYTHLYTHMNILVGPVKGEVTPFLIN